MSWKNAGRRFSCSAPLLALAVLSGGCAKEDSGVANTAERGSVGDAGLAIHADASPNPTREPDTDASNEGSPGSKPAPTDVPRSAEGHPMEPDASANSVETQSHDAAASDSGPTNADADSVTDGPLCGNAMVDPGEECDDGNETADDACDQCHAMQSPPSCGDGHVDQGDEECDDGIENGSPNSFCTAQCRLNVCGDGILSPSEGCDDGNTDPNDWCSNTCNGDGCGDGVLQISEACDDGVDNGRPGSECTATCQLNVCNDGIVGPHEECDEGFLNGEGDCSLSCTLTVTDGGAQGPRDASVADGATSLNESDATLLDAGLLDAH